ncbi:IPT/TIG domain-containing protein [Salinibacterium soli]|uniref:IPT/TIG domain-containing protein n=1 Tax=Antiquaquibacter soli TaxID=3064523 RepID=A0ABT9BSG6_9MICO|nr:IPT/TIG domain-containing protein [Protaetiibacter sp. WY-16]MDO7882731.1 IPT/TIG domain-containing protein [Protaetiibacter sp. WY-16]
MSRSRSVRPARFGLRALAALAAGLLASFTTGVIAVQAAPGDESHATGTYLSGSLLNSLTPTQLAEIGSAAADNDGTQATQTENNALNATVLQSLAIDIGGGLQIPLNVADAGALTSFAQAEADGSSVGASGLVASDGAIGVGEVDPGDVPSPMTLDLSDVLGATFAAELANLTLALEATSASATADNGGTPVGDYEIAGSTLTINSNTVAGLSDEIGLLLDAVESDVNDLTGPDGSLVDGVFDVADSVFGLLGLGTADASITVDLDTVVAPYLGTLDAGSGISLDLTTGDIIVDLEVLNGGTLNDLDPNTNILTSTQLSAITTAISTRLGLLADDIETAVETALGAATVDVDVDLTIDLGVGFVPLANVSVGGTIDEILAGDGTYTVTALGAVPVGGLTEALLEPAVQDLLDPLLDDTTGTIATLVADLQTEVVDPVLEGVNPLLLLLDDVLLLTVNNQDPEPPVAEQLFTETAFRLQLLPEASGPLGEALELTVASASVGPNVVAAAVPSISGIDPDNGPESGGTVVTVTGTGFTGATGVTFDGTPGTVFSVDSDTQITVTSPPHAPATVDVVVVHPDGNSEPADFTYTPLVSVTDIDPNFGPTEGGTPVTITGTCFTGATGVTFDGVAGTSFVVVNDTTITVVSPPHAEGAVDVVVQGSLACGGDETVPDGFTYVADDAPVITGLTPDNGPESGGTVVTITGTGFTGATGVTFDGIAGTVFSVDSDTQITVTSPPHAPGLVGVIVLHPDGNSGPEDFTYTPLVSVTEIDPDFGPEAGGTDVTITGTCFTGATGVLFDGVPGTSFVVVNDTTITVVTPPGTPGFVDVTILGSVSCGGNEVVPDGFEYIADDAPVILSLVPDSGPHTGGTAVLVSGSGFTGATGVTFDGVAALNVVVVDDETITLITPPGEVGPAEVRVLHPNGNSAPLTFTYLPATSIDDVDPDHGPESGNTIVTITGSCFTGATGVFFGTTPALEFEVIDDSTIVAVAPPGTGIVDVTVVGTEECGDDTLDDGYRYIPAGLALTGLMTTLPALGGALGLVILGLVLALTRRSREA